MLGALAGLVAGSRRRAAVTVVVWLALAAVLPLLAPKLASVENNATANNPPASADSVAAGNLLQRAFPGQRGTPAIVVFRDRRGLTSQDLQKVRAVTQRLTGPGRPPHVLGAVSITSQPQASGTLLSRDRTTTMAVVRLGGSTSAPGFVSTVDKVAAMAGHGSGDLQIRLTGPAGIVRDTTKAFSSANVVLLLGVMVLVLVLLLLIYRAPLLAAMPLIAVGIAVQTANAAGAALVKAGAFQVNSQTSSIMTVLLFGVGTDYCLFIISRYREELGGQPDQPAAMSAAVRQVGEALVSSAATVMLGLLILLLATLPALRGFGPFLALAVAVMLVVALTFVPAVVVLAGSAAFWPTWLQRSGHAEERPRSFWARTARLVLAYPVRTVAASLALLGILAGGLAQYRQTYNELTGFRVATDSRQGQQMLNTAFPSGQLAPTTVLVDAGQPLTGHPASIDHITAAIAALPAVRSVTGPTRPAGRPIASMARAETGPGRAFLSADGKVAMLTVVYTDNPYQSPALNRTLTVRTVARRALAQTGLAHARILVGGQSAISADLRSAGQHDLGVVAPLTLLVIGLVLALVLRSLVAPLYLVATIVVSLLATVGLTVFVMLTLLGDEGIGDRVTLYIFVFLVALGVDYNIYLMTRVRQEIRQRGPTDGLYTALARSGGVISSAGVILAGTFAVLMTQPIRELFQFGFAMAAGILLDTFLVRAVLVPAIVRLLGAKSLWPARLSGAPAQPPVQAAAPGNSTRRERLSGKVRHVQD